MNRRPSSFRSLAAAAAADSATSYAAAMYFRPHFRGGCSQDRRAYSDRPPGPPSGDHAELVSGDSHFCAVREANRGFRPSYNADLPPPQYVTGQQFYGPGLQSHRPGTPVFQQLPGPPHPYRLPRPVEPVFSNYQQFRPQQVPQLYRPRASKPPDYRDWEYGKPGLPSHCERFTVLSYNILADYLATEHYHKLYFHIPRYIMDWNWRKRNICFELGLWSADILCFQEVDRFQDLEAELRPRGYAGIWKMRTGDPADGCAIFWRVLRFKLLHEESIEYNKLGLRDNVAQICVFEYLNGQHNSNGVSTLSTSGSPASSNRVVVCNIHVLFNPKRGDVKLGQIRALLDRAHAVSKLWDDAPVVICGDFNCTPKSHMYNFISEQKLHLSELARDKVSGQASAEIRPPRPACPDFSAGQSPSHFHEDDILNDNLHVEHEIVSSDVGNSYFSPSAWTPAEIQIATGSTDTDNKIVEHPLKLRSAYAEVENTSGLRDSSGEPFVTSYHKCFSGTVDYIWHTEGLQTAKILAPIPKHVMQQTQGFPTKKWGSDHIALVSEFAFNKDMSSENASQ